MDVLARGTTWRHGNLVLGRQARRSRVEHARGRNHDYGTEGAPQPRDNPGLPLAPPHKAARPVWVEAAATRARAHGSAARAARAGAHLFLPFRQVPGRAGKQKTERARRSHMKTNHPHAPAHTFSRPSRVGLTGAGPGVAGGRPCPGHGGHGQGLPRVVPRVSATKAALTAPALFFKLCCQPWVHADSCSRRGRGVTLDVGEGMWNQRRQDPCKAS